MQEDLVFRRLAEADIYDRHVRNLYCLGWQNCLRDVVGVHDRSMRVLDLCYADCLNWEYSRYRWLYDLTLRILEEKPTLWSLLRERGAGRVRLIELFRTSLNDGLVKMLDEAERDLARACRIKESEAAILCGWKRGRMTMKEQAQELEVGFYRVGKLRQQILDKVRANLNDNYLIHATLTTLPPGYGDKVDSHAGQFWQ